MSNTPDKIIEYHGDLDKNGTEVDVIPLLTKIKLIDKLGSSEAIKKVLIDKQNELAAESG